MKIYTKTGDKGTTSLVDGKRVPKYDLRLESYGTIDELNSYLGLIRSQAIDEHSKQVLIKIQNHLFTIGSILATEHQENIRLKSVDNQDVEFLEREMDTMDTTLPPLKNFVLQGGNNLVSFCHIARCVCRRAERISQQLATQTSVNPIILMYINRLSDYLFVLARKFSLDSGLDEVLWKPDFL